MLPALRFFSRGFSISPFFRARRSLGSSSSSSQKVATTLEHPFSEDDALLLSRNGPPIVKIADTFHGLKRTLELGSHLAVRPLRGDIICLTGEAGSGKSVLAAQYIREAIHQPTLVVTSPTYVLVNRYPVQLNPKEKLREIHHMDLFRIKSEEELKVLELEKAFSKDVCVIEWAEKLASQMPTSRVLNIHFDILDDGESRKVTLSSSDHEWIRRITATPFLTMFHNLEKKEEERERKSLRERRTIVGKRRNEELRKKIAKAA